MFTIKRYWLLLPLVLMAACSHSNGAFNENIMFSSNAGKGLIVGSVSRTAYLPSRYTFENIETGKKIWFREAGPDKFVSASDDFEKGVLFALPADAGVYNFDKYTITRSDSRYATFSKNKDKMNVPFEVKSNQVTYIGEFNPVQLRVGSGLEVNDMRGRDIPLLKEKHPNLNWKNVQYNILKMP